LPSNKLTPAKLDAWFTSLGLNFPKLKIIAISLGACEEKKGIVPSLPPANFLIPAINLPVLGSHWPQATLISGPVVTLVGGASPSASAVDEKELSPEGEFERAVASTQGWLEKRKRCDVESLVALANTDLRAGDDWLVYVSPAVKKRLGRRMW
jgi:hypothetical protein